MQGGESEKQDGTNQNSQPANFITRHLPGLGVLVKNVVPLVTDHNPGKSPSLRTCKDLEGHFYRTGSIRDNVCIFKNTALQLGKGERAPDPPINMTAARICC